MNKKGIALGDLPQVVLVMVVAAAFLVGGFLALDGLGEGNRCPTGYVYDSASQLCDLATNASITTGQTFAGNSTTDVEIGLDNITDQIPTVGTLIGVGLLLAVIGGAFVIGRKLM